MSPCGCAAGADGRDAFRAEAGARRWEPGDLLDESEEVLRAVRGRRDRARRYSGRMYRVPMREQAEGEAAGQRRTLVAERYPWLADPLLHLYVGFDDECFDALDELGHGAEASHEHP